MYEDIQDSFRILPTSDYSEDIDYGHGRIEIRKCTIITDLSLVENADKWKGLASIIKIEREQYFKVTAKKENEASYYVSTLSDTTSIAYGV